MEAIAVCFFGVMAILLLSETLYRKKILNGELYRKQVHAATGIFIAFWPWLISWRAIEVLGVAMAGVVLLNRMFDVLHITHRVRRISYGDVLFALAVVACAALTDIKIFFAIAVLHLALADSAAALIGQKYGQNFKYKIVGQTKTLIGSMAFWMTSLIVLGVGLIFAHNYISFGDYALLVIALPPVLTIVENLSVFGVDNATIPLVVILALKLVQA